ncbi:heme-binding protein [Ciceribacter sp. RN22]|uniref:GlcG/HbpS family heme-binding protein n=1 Tax=Ciceribacter sp. RN22 TaxID=2954932 RepID=UPI0020921213|nr:heme-binding protein [Ciceribacter sp. RN22]MCO6179601.1 heme-binding protein [Ciceribacter sp. RN22]
MLKLSEASDIIDAALAEGRARALAPLAVTVLDAGGHLVAYKREDGSGIARFDIAFAKAWGSLGLGFGSRELTARTAKNPSFFMALGPVSGGRIAPSPGGVLILNHDGDVVGAVGISGDLGDNDEFCAIAGVEAAGFRAVPGMVE